MYTSILHIYLATYQQDGTWIKWIPMKLYQVQLFQYCSLCPCVALLSIFNCPFSVKTTFQCFMIINFMIYIA